MDFMTNMENMFPMDKEERESLALNVAVDDIKVIEEVSKFFSSDSGRLFLSWLDEVKRDRLEELETVKPENLFEVQANIKALKTFYLILEEKMSEMTTKADFINSLKTEF